MDLTAKQKKLVVIGRNNGRVTQKDIRYVYSDKSAGKNAMLRLSENGFFKIAENAMYYVYCGSTEGTILDYA